MTIRTTRSLLFWPLALVFLIACQQSQENSSANTGEPAMAAGETSKDFGDYVVHFNALATDQLTADIAKSYGIVRSANRAMLTVSIIKKETGTTGTAVSGSVSASANNLTGQLKQVPLRVITEGEAIYYIGETTVANQETLIFNVDVTPMNEASRFSIRFQKKFYVD